MEDIESQQAISCSQAKLPVASLYIIQLSYWPRVSHEDF